MEGSQQVVEATVERGSIPDGPELLHHSAAKPNELHVASGERASKRTSRTTTKPARKRRSSAHNMLSRSTGASPDLGKMAEDQVVDHTSAGVIESRVDRRKSLPPFTFDNVEEEVPEGEVDPCDCTLSDYPVLSSIGLEEEKHVSQLPRPPLPVTPPIWAQVRRIVAERKTVIWFLVSTGSVRDSGLLQELSRWRLS